MIKRIATTASLALLALPAGAMAAGSAHGTLLSVNRKAHVIEVVDGGHAVHSYHYSGKLPALAPGAHLTFHRRGGKASHIKAARGSSVTFLARVVRSSTKGVVLRLTDGRKLNLSSSQLKAKGKFVSKTSTRKIKPAFEAHMATGLHLANGSVTVNIEGLQPGLTVLVTEATDSSGALSVTITLPPAATPGVSGQQASGVLAQVAEDAFVLRTADGSLLRMHTSAAALTADGLAPCDEVSVTYHQDSDLLIVDQVSKTGAATTGKCASNSQGGSDASSQGGHDSGSNTTGDSGSDTTGDSGSDTTGDSGSDTTGDSGSGTTGDSGSDTTGDSGSDVGGDAGSSTDPQDVIGSVASVSGRP